MVNSGFNLKALAKSPLFHGMGTRELQELLQKTAYQTRPYSRGEVIAVEDDDCGAIGVILAGSVQVQKTYPSGKIVVLNTLEEGDTFGEVTVFSELRRYPATIVTLTEGEILFLFRDGIKNLCRASETFLENFLRLLSAKILMLNRKVKILSYKSIREKVAAYLLEQYRLQKSASITLPANRKETAEFLGIPRPSLSRELAALKKEGLIDFHKNCLTLLNPESLQALTEQ